MSLLYCICYIEKPLNVSGILNNVYENFGKKKNTIIQNVEAECPAYSFRTKN